MIDYKDAMPVEEQEDAEKGILKKTETFEDEQLPDEIGDVKVADEVISIVAGLAAQEVHGVIGMSASFTEGLNEFLGKKNFAKGVRVTVDGRVVTVVVYVNVEYGSCIPEIALEIQEKVKDSIENMTGYEVKFVDVHIQGVARRPKSELEESLEKMDTTYENTFSEE